MNDNRITNGYLDDTANAWKFYQEKLNTAQDLLEQIFMVTSGNAVFDRTSEHQDWAQENLLLIFEMFMIHHENFNVRTFAEDLQGRIFTSTQERDDAYLEWREKVFAEQGLDDDGEPLGIGEASKNRTEETN